IEKTTGTGRDQTNQDDEANLDFSDMQVKAVYDLSPRHQLGISSIFGIFQGDQGDDNRSANQNNLNFIDKHDSHNLFVNAHWNYTPGSRLFAQTRVFLLETSYKNTSHDRLILDDIDRTQFGVRNDVSFLARHSQHIEAGLYVRRAHAEKLTNFFRVSKPATPLVLESFD